MGLQSTVIEMAFTTEGAWEDRQQLADELLEQAYAAMGTRNLICVRTVAYADFHLMRVFRVKGYGFEDRRVAPLVIDLETMTKPTGLRRPMLNLG